MYCKYYQAKSLKNKTWFIFGCLRNEENLAFGRTLDISNSIIEFFVPIDFQEKFENLMKFLLKKGYIFEFIELPNRLVK